VRSLSSTDKACERSTIYGVRAVVCVPRNAQVVRSSSLLDLLRFRALTPKLERYAHAFSSQVFLRLRALSQIVPLRAGSSFIARFSAFTRSFLSLIEALRARSSLFQGMQRSCASRHSLECCVAQPVLWIRDEYFRIRILASKYLWICLRTRR
jgi:hypothetical protein